MTKQANPLEREGTDTFAEFNDAGSSSTDVVGDPKPSSDNEVQDPRRSDAQDPYADEIGYFADRRPK